MSVHLRVQAELNDFVKPDEQYTVLRRPFRPHQMESPERTKQPCVPDVDAVTVREPATRTAASDVGDGAGRGDVTIVRGNVQQRVEVPDALRAEAENDDAERILEPPEARAARPPRTRPASEGSSARSRRALRPEPVWRDRR